jgi:hypothetical protein
MLKIKKLSFVILILSFLILIKGCPIDIIPTYKDITVINNSDKIVAIFITNEDHITGNSCHYRDSLLPGSIRKYSDPASHMYLEIDTMKNYLYVMETRIIYSLPWDTVKKYNMYLKRTVFTKKSLDSTGWVLTYP